ncbi:MAG: bifunctional demethylmenaquinone methyltransferase/2-methoxy-6-polyprenyl-1,4-benzoquinol methylase UbiE [Pseudobdellovibrionaceae bacterium]
MPESQQIKNMFTQVASGYDRANDILSLGIHHLWRKEVVRMSGVKAGSSILDCATGTGDLAIEFKKAVGPSGKVIGTDFCEAMIQPAPAKALKSNLDIQFQIEDVMNLSFAKSLFDVCSISFGIRNVEDPKKALTEMARVTKPGGKVIVLEFGEMKAPVIGPLYQFYSEKILPKLGGLITGQTTAYEYLQKSSAQFPSREKFLALMESTQCFRDCSYRTLSLGIAYIYIGSVLDK